MAFLMSELRISAALQAALVSLAAGWLARGSPAGGPARLWPYVAFGYAFVCAVSIWLLDFSQYRRENARAYAAINAVLTAFYAIPFSLAAHWLKHGPYRTIAAIALWIVLGSYGLAAALYLVGRARVAPGPPSEC